MSWGGGMDTLDLLDRAEWQDLHNRRNRRASLRSSRARGGLLLRGRFDPGNCVHRHVIRRSEGVRRD